MMGDLLPDNLGEDLIAVLALIRDSGGTDCTGT
jgi:hypothetical protein